MSILLKKYKYIVADSGFYGKTVAVLLFFLLILKQWAIFMSYGGQTSGGFSAQVLLFLSFFGSDLMIVGMVLFLIFLGVSTKNVVAKLIINIANILVVLIFFVDVIAIFFFQSRINLSDIYGFFSFSLTGYFSLYTLFSFLFLAILSFLSWIISQKFLKKWSNTPYWLYISLVFFIVTVLVTSINFFTRNKESFSNNIFLINTQHLQDAYFKTSEESPITYQSYFTGFSGLNTKPNIILLFAESLSTVDSKRAGGLYDNLPLFDIVQSQGITFTNFIANGCTSETAHIAILKGVEPWEYPLIDTNTTYDSYAAYGEPLPLFMQNHGYVTAFVSSVTLDFLNQRDFISGLQFQHIVGEESFRNQKKYVFDAAPDDVLYKKVIDLASSYATGNVPYFLAVQNISAHRPYDTPYGKTSQQMFSYVDKSLHQFYQNLEDIGFFDNGILVVVSDHRKMEPITKDEFETFGLSAKSRVVATVIGTGIASGVINNTIFQHTDLYNSLKYLVASGTIQLSTLFNDVFSPLTNRDWGIRYCRYADKVYFRINQNGSSWMITDKQEDTPLKQYIWAYKGFQAQSLLGLSGVVDYETPSSLSYGTSLVLIARGSNPYEKWSLNTFDSAIRAQKDGADGLYLDVVFTKDGHGVVLHGSSLKDTECGTGKDVGEFILKDLQEQCRFKNGSQIFTLKEFLFRTKDLFTLFFLDIHYVFDSTVQEVEMLIRDITKLGIENKVVFISSDKQIDAFLLSHDTLLVGSNYLSSLTSGASLGFNYDFYLFSGNTIDQSSVELIKALKKNIVLSLSDDYDSLDTALSFGIPYIITDNLSLVKKMLSPQLK